MKTSIYDIIKSDYAVNQEDGRMFFDSLPKSEKEINGLTISFVGVKHLSTLFLNESIGRLALIFPEKIKDINFIYPKNKPLFERKVNDVIENALMGDEFDILVDAAKTSL